MSTVLSNKTPERASSSQDSVTLSTEVVKERYERTASGDSLLTPESLCVVCRASSYTEKGLFCDALNHFQCDDCITQWITTLNEQKKGAPDLLRARNGLMSCVESGCTSTPFKASAICVHVKDLDVLEQFLDCLTHTHTLVVEEQYQSDLGKKLAMLNGIKENDDSIRMKKKIELEALAQNLRLSLRRPRMCRQCKFGPVENPWCDDLQCHHGDTMRTTQPTVNNACPNCGWFNAEWSQWLPWDGNLPEELRGDIEITPAERPRRPCRYFAHGHCRRGENCTFLHNSPVTTTTAAEISQRRNLPPRPQCRHYAAGSCRRGNACRYRHAEVLPTLETPAAVPAAGHIVASAAMVNNRARVRLYRRPPRASRPAPTPVSAGAAEQLW